MTDDQAERSIRELRGIRVGIFLVSVVLAVGTGLKLGESLGTHGDPMAPVTSELSNIRSELQFLRGELAKHSSPVLPPLPLPKNKPNAGNGK
jgi:hypothetical protein